MSRHVCLEALEGRRMFALTGNGSFVIEPPGGGQGHETIKLQPSQGIIGLNTSEANSGGVVNWTKTATHEWDPGDHAGPHQFAS